MVETVKSLSRNKARLFAKLIKETFNLGSSKVDIARLLEKLPNTNENMNVEIVDDEEMAKGDYAYFVPDFENGKSVIIISNKVYESACGSGSTSGRDRMTIAHEIAHYFLMMNFGYRPIEKYRSGQVSPFNDPEWQAKALAGEIMMPFEETDSFMNPSDLANEFGVSFDAADYRINGYGKIK